MKPEIKALLVFLAVGAAVAWFLFASDGSGPPKPTVDVPAATAGAPASAPVVVASPNPSSTASAGAAGAAGAPGAAEREEAPAAPDEVSLYFTANGMGEIEDCGCQARPLGGIAKRAQFITDRAKRYAASLAVDAGGSLAADAEIVIETPDELADRSDAIFASMAQMGYVALNVGARDLTVGVDVLKAKAKAHGIALVSANLVDAKTRKPAFEPWIVRPLGKIKVGIFGLVTSSPVARKARFDDQGLAIEAMIPAARAAVAALRSEGADVIIVLSQLARKEIDALGDEVPQIDLVLGSTDMELTQRLERLGRGFHADPYNKGKWIGELRLRVGKNADRWFANAFRSKVDIELVSLERQAGWYTKKFAEEDAPGATKTMDERERKFAEERFVNVRAKLQRVRMEREGEIDATADSSVLDLELFPLGEEVTEDPAVRKILDAHEHRFPQRPKPGH